MDDINYNEVRAGIEQNTPEAEALGSMVRGVLREAVAVIANGLHNAGVDPRTMPSDYLVQAALVEAEKVFRPFSGQEAWNEVYTTYLRVNLVMREHPELQQLRQEVLRAKIAGKEPATSSEADVDAFLRDVLGEA